MVDAQDVQAPKGSGLLSLIDSRIVFCQAARMSHPLRQLIAMLLAIWLPFFSGSALAASVAMQMTSGDCNVSAALEREHHASVMHHDELVQFGDEQNQQNSGCNDCGVCHYACSGYMVNVADMVMDQQSSMSVYVTLSNQIRSYTSAPLDPPPLSRV